MKKQPKENSEFRNVHAAKALLEAYISSGYNLELIRQFNFSEIQRYDVWQCVFEKEKKAFKILQEKELYNLLLKYPEIIKEEGKSQDLLWQMASTLCVIHLERSVEWESPLGVDEALQIMVDIFGDKFLPILLDEANVSLARRLKIIAPYFKKDDEWVGYSVKTVKAIEKLLDPK